MNHISGLLHTESYTAIKSGALNSNTRLCLFTHVLTHFFALRLCLYVYLGIIDNVLQELDNRFDKVNMKLLVCMSALNPMNSFASYDKNKVLSLANFYPNDFSSTDLMRLFSNLITSLMICEAMIDLKA